MKYRWLIVLLAVVPLLARAIDRDEEHTFAVQPGCALKVDLYRGGIDVQESDGDEITMNRERVLTDAKARALELARSGYKPPVMRGYMPAPGENVLSLQR